jgi:opacity protein-like surface antigen
MKKSLFVAIIAIFISTALFAQDDIKIGVTGGLINSNTSVKLSAFSVNLLNLSAINKVGYYVGAIGDVGISEKLHVQAELTYGSAGDLGFIFLPIMVKYYIMDGLNVQLGPQFNISTNVGEIKGAIRDIEDVVGSNGNIDDVISKTGIDLGIGAGYDITDHLSAQARFAFEMTNRYNGPINNSLKVRSSSFNIGIAYFF